jgi:2-polyprenyl-6-methoxyphenol hydroxylase-like FAD-dependent oxidoreductase
VDEIRAAAARRLAPQLGELVENTVQPILQPIYDLETPQMALGRVALIGDAAFAARPHVGAGVAKAALDALALADELEPRPDVDSALRAFEAKRLPAGRRIVGRARELGAYLEGKTDWADNPDSHADAIMAETAVLDFLR